MKLYRQTLRFRLAHAIARQLEGDYRACFALALKMVASSYEDVKRGALTYYDQVEHTHAGSFGMYARYSDYFDSMSDFNQVSQGIIDILTRSKN